MDSDLLALPGLSVHADVSDSCTVLPILRERHLALWLIGDVDASVQPQLDGIRRQAERVCDQLSLEASRITFCDSTLVSFIAEVGATIPVTVRRPSRALVQLLTATGMADRVSFAPEPRPAQP